ncbi:alpha/beta hydrolase [Streptomyces sp. 4F14]|uniref:alpha/beta hydrolase n=1 Tax=Streptomyces sp. 4F14 TaxID=3394380 RepID=UPI003A849806
MSTQHRHSHRTRSRHLLAAGALAATLLGQLLTGTTATAAPEKPGRISWKPCTAPDGTAGFECATLKVPVDHAKPKGATIALALNRHRATDPARRIGPLLVNPGGPGGSGVDFAFGAPSSLSPALLARFDIIGFDPRGVSRSHPVMCDWDLVVRQDPLLYPGSARDFTALRAANRALGKDCRARSGPLFEHMDTGQVVQDMDAIRAALGERRISYYGVSYGTAIGQQYAARYPQRVRALALDSNMDHSLDRSAFQRTEAVAMEEVYGQFADWCARTPACELYGRDARALFDSLYRRAEAGELELPGGIELKPQDVQLTVFGFLYDPVSWFQLADLLSDIDDPGEDTARRLAAFGEPAPYPFPAVMCQDYAFGVPAYNTLVREKKALARYAPVTRLSPLGWTAMTGCQNWPAKVTNPPRPLKVDGTPPILLTNSRFDPATPHDWAANAARQIGREAVLLTYDGAGHGDYWLSPCARSAIDTYLLTLKTPRPGTHCPALWPTEPAPEERKGALVNPLPDLIGTPRY